MRAILPQLSAARVAIDVRGEIAPAQKLVQQNHLVLPVGNAVLLGPVESLDAVTELGACPTARLLGFQDARPQELRNILQLVSGKAQEKLARFAPLLVTNDRAKRFHEDSLHRR
jgi:hypothetical protein